MSNNPYFTSEPKKISLVCPSLAGGGAERSLINLSIGLIELGYQVDVVLFNAEGPFLDFIPVGAKLVNFKQPHASRSLVPMVKYLREVKPNAVFTYLDHVSLVVSIAKFISGGNTRINIGIRDNSEATNRRTIKKGIEVFLQRIFFTRAERVIAVSKGAALNAKRHFRLKIMPTAIYNPVITPDFDQMRRQQIEHPWFSDSNTPVVLGVGRLNEQKDFATLIRAFAKVRGKIHARLVILGAGPLREELISLADLLKIGDDFQLAGFHENPLPFMDKCSVFVLSSVHEGLPGVLIQAMACGATLVSTDCPSGPREILEDGKFGKLVPIGDVETLSAAIIESIQNPAPAPVEAVEKFEYLRSARLHAQAFFEDSDDTL